MSTREAIPQMGRLDFLAIVVPGFFLLIDCWLVGLAFSYPQGDGLWIAAGQYMQMPTQNWTVFLGVILASYLLGSLVRAAPVNAADRLSQVVLAPIRLILWPIPAVRYYMGSSFEPFPYRSILAQTLDNVSGTQAMPVGDPVVDALRDALKAPDPSLEFSAEARLHTFYNYWKVAICDAAPGAADFTQELEARVRLFAGMFWAGFLGGLLLLGGFASAGVEFWNDWQFWSVFLLSIVIGSVFGINVGRVRREEVRHVFLAYLAALKRLDGDNR